MPENPIDPPAALYRRYRPESFAEVIGQEQVTTPLSAALNMNRINHAYLFSGPRGCGKTTSARIFARCINCAQGPTADPCGICESCVELARGGSGSLDVVEIDAASNGGVDDARSLRERAAFAPVRDRYKVFIIDEAHMVSTQGFNALLKLVEEPPAHVRFVFATTEPDKVIGTIRSRTHHYPFRLVPPDELQRYVLQVCETEGVILEQAVAPLVVRAGAGSVRDTLSVLDQLIAGSGTEPVSYRQAVGLLGYTDAALIDDFIDALVAADGPATFAVVDRIIQTGLDPRRFTEDLLERLRDLVVAATVPDGGYSALSSVPRDQVDRIRGQAGRLSRGELVWAAEVTNRALTEMTGATSPRLQVELLAARLLLPGADADAAALTVRLERMERRLAAAGGTASPTPSFAPVVQAAAADLSDRELAAVKGGGTASRNPATEVSVVQEAESPTPESPTRAIPVALTNNAGVNPTDWATAPAADGSGAVRGAAKMPPVPPQMTASAQVGAVDLTAIRRAWPDILARVSRLKRATWSLVSEHAQVAEFDGTRLVVVMSSSGLATTFSRGSHAEVVAQAIADELGLKVQIDAIAGGAPPAGPATAATSAAAALPETAPSAELTAGVVRLTGDGGAAWPEPVAPRFDVSSADSNRSAARDDPAAFDDSASFDDPTVEDEGADSVALVEKILGGVVIDDTRT